MSDTKRSADDVMKLLDRDAVVVLFRNGLGSYTACAMKKGWFAHEIVNMAVDTQFPEGDGDCITDDFTPSQALYRLTEKAFGNIA